VRNHAYAFASIKECRLCLLMMLSVSTKRLARPSSKGLAPERFLLTIAALLFLVTGCSKDSDAPKGKGQGKKGRPPASVQVAKVRTGKLDSQARFLGNVRSAMSTPIAAAVAGTVDKVHVREGEHVKKDQLMLEMDARRIRADLKAAEALIRKTKAQLAQARRQAERIKESGAALSEPEREGYRLQVSVLEAQQASEEAAAQRVRVDLSHHRIAAPFAGVLKSRLVNPGAWVRAGDPVVELVSTEEIEVLVEVPFESGQAIQPGDAATFFAVDRSVKAQVAGVVPALDSETRTMKLRLVVAEGVEPPKWLLPGLALDVELARVIQGDGVLVPRDAVIRGPVKSRVIKVSDGVGVVVPVVVLGSTEKEALVRGEGLVAGDVVMTRGNERYRPGTPINIEQVDESPELGSRVPPQP
jgi:RND family efflux transporter MFP subunit